MNYLVTGANGFVGKLLCVELLKRGQTVRAALRSPHQVPGGVESVTIGTIDGNTDWTETLRGVDVVIHLAARVHVMKDTAADPLAEFLKVNLHGTENLAEQAVKAGVKRLIYVSSIKVNGEQTQGQHSYTEQDIPTPQDPYGISKWEAEQSLQRIMQRTGLEVVIVRPPLVYGQGVKGNFINLLAAINKGIPLPLAAANNKRSLIYVGNLVDVLITCATHPSAAGQTYLVRDGEDISTAALVEKIVVALGCKSRSFYFPPNMLRLVAAVLGRSNQVARLLGSLRVSDTKIRSELGWTSSYTLEQGLQATVDWYRTERSI